MTSTAWGGPDGVSCCRIARKAPFSIQLNEACPRAVADRSGKNAAFETSVCHSPTRKLSWLSAGFVTVALCSAIDPQSKGATSRKPTAGRDATVYGNELG